MSRIQCNVGETVPAHAVPVQRSERSPYRVDFGDRLTWRKASRSGGNGGDCVAVAVDAARVGVRDTKAGSSGPVLWLGRGDFGALARTARS
ncbi:DUF397 domain-containing protein [Glycomyces tritici]|uniref:DUF397 domain-containing protein n=1 Tax=Glycomyces tritici TaxID=2665176 RepID=A0ABT7YWL5_9ACTN|nr:DUF397 domain-containing protein [Glycomyces tritici]MDN3243014.1 DUF397 domain-containing protein [Glycomyces tritici]